jgi:hypothetical protein
MKKIVNKPECEFCGGTGFYEDYFITPKGRRVKLKQLCICKEIKEFKDDKSKSRG